MKNLKIISVLAFTAIALVSCKNTENEQRYAYMDSYIDYVDSINSIAASEVSEQWNDIENNFNRRKTQVENDLNSITDGDKLKAEYERKVSDASDKFEQFKINVKQEAEKIKQANEITNFRNSLFGNANVGIDSDFSWVNKDNILATYDKFVNTVSDNKDSYSSEQWEEIKSLYEALDSRKNIVEKEGLTSEDNRKIAALKVKFASIYAIRKIVAKSESK